MTDARREPVTETDVIAAEHIIASAHYKSKDWTNVYLVPIEQHRALADRLAAAEETNRIAALHLSEMEQRLAASEKADYDVDGVIDHLKQRLAEVERGRDEARATARLYSYKNMCAAEDSMHKAKELEVERLLHTVTPEYDRGAWEEIVADLRQQLTDAQATMAKQAAELEAIRDTVGETEFALRQQVARLTEQLRLCNIDQLLAEQQVARLRECLVEYMTLADKICYAEPEYTQYHTMKTKASHALRETGA